MNDLNREKIWKLFSGARDPYINGRKNLYDFLDQNPHLLELLFYNNIIFLL